MLDAKNVLTELGNLALLGNALFCELGNKPPIPAYPLSSASSAVNRCFLLASISLSFLRTGRKNV
jgi:hypothetical protein